MKAKLVVMSAVLISVLGHADEIQKKLSRSI